MTLAIKNGLVFLPDGKLSPGTVIVSGERIDAVGDAAAGANVEIPPDATVIDAAGKTVMPGLIDAHTHLTLIQDPMLLNPGAEGKMALRGAQLAFRALRAGITTMRDMGGYRYADIDLRNAIAAGQVPGPRLLCAGKVVATTGGHIYYVAREADGPHEVRKAAREQLKAGADFVKVMCSGGVERANESENAVQLTMDEIEAAVEVARDAGTVVAAHVHPPRAMLEAVKAGVASVEHGSFLDNEVADAMARRRVCLVPTFSVYTFIAAGGPPDIRERAKRVAEVKRKTFELALRYGVPWGVGTDSGAFSPVESLVNEIVMTAELGVDNAEALRHATAVNAELLRLDTGAIEAGKRADLIVVDGNPVEDLWALNRVTMTIRDGVVYDWSGWPGN